MSLLKLAEEEMERKKPDKLDRAIAGGLIATPTSFVWGATKEGMKSDVMPDRGRASKLLGVGRTTGLGALMGAVSSPIGRTIDNLNQNIGSKVYRNELDKDEEMKQKMIGASATGGILGSFGGPIGTIAGGSIAAGEAGLNTKLTHKVSDTREQMQRGLKDYVESKKKIGGTKNDRY